VKSRPLTALAFASTLIAGCGATTAQRQFQTMRAGYQAAATELLACVATLDSKPDYAPVLSHLPSLANKALPTAAQLSDDTYATPDEAQLMLRYEGELTQCRRAPYDRAVALNPALAPIFDRAILASSANLADLVGHKITWAEQARRRSVNVAHLQSDLHDIDVVTTAELSAAHQQELADRQEAAATAGRVLGGIAAVAGAAAAGYVAAQTPPTVVYAPVVVCRGWNC
jgi:hypothetical protein